LDRLFEDSRNDLLSKSKNSDSYDISNRQNGKNRFQRRLKSNISNSVSEYNKINTNKLFKEDELSVNVRVHGETSLYLVTVSFNGVLNSLSGMLPKDATEDDITFGRVLRALTDAFNHNDVRVHCTCPDFQYRQAYWATVNGTNAGPAETRPSDETNPDDTKGAGCKHINMVLSNRSWLMKVASVITNYIRYMKEHYEKLYADVMYPAIFDREYVEPVQQDFNNEINGLASDELMSDEDTIDTSNKWAKTKTQFKPGNQSGVRFAKSDSNDIDDDTVIDGQQKMFDIDSIDDEEDIEN